MTEPQRESVLELWSRRTDVCSQLTEALTGLGFEVRLLGEKSHLDLFLDTDDWLLFRSGAALRLRIDESKAKLSMEPLSKTGASPEPEELLEKAPEGFPAPVPSGRICRRLSTLVKDLSVDIRLQLDRRHVTHRATMPDGFVVDIECRTVRVGPEGSRESFSELMLSAAGGSVAQLDVLASPLGTQFGLVQADRHALARGLEAARIAVPTLVEGSDLTLRPEDRFVDAAHRVLRRQLRRMLWNEAGTKLGLDPENLHSMRVASRRLRAALSCFAEGLPAGRVEVLRRNLRWVGRALGHVRDLDVHLVRLEEDGRELAPEMKDALELYRKFLNDRRNKARADMLRVLGTRRYESFVDGFNHLLESGAPRRSKVVRASTPVTAVASEIIKSWLKKVLRDGRMLGVESADADLHRLRIRCKRLRYACEFFADLFGPEAVKFAERVTEIQDILGIHHDAVVAGETLAKFAREMSVPRRLRRQVFMTLGHLMAQQAYRAKAARTEFAKLWKRFDRKKNRKPILAKLEPSLEEHAANPETRI